MDRKTLAITDKKRIKKTYLIASFDKLKINYIAIPKTASTSILYALLVAEGKKIKKPIPGKDANSWIHNEDLIKYIKPEQVQANYKNFTVVRNPLERAYSMYYDFCLHRPEWGSGGSDKFAKNFNLIRRKCSFKDFLILLTEYSDIERGSHFRTQTRNCILPGMYIFKLENMHESIPYLVPNINLERKLNTHKYKYKISKEEKSLIYDIYAKDFPLWLHADE